MQETTDPEEIYEHRVITDMREAADTLRPVYDESGRQAVLHGVHEQRARYTSPGSVAAFIASGASPPDEPSSPTSTFLDNAFLAIRVT